MPAEPWFPLKFEVQSGIFLGQILNAGLDWQIYQTTPGNKVLFAKLSLANRWEEFGVIADSLLTPFSFGDETFRLLESGINQRLEPIEECLVPDNKSDGLLFASSLRETRMLMSNEPLHDSIYSERYSRLLPTWSTSEKLPDEEIFGRWLTGGVSVQATSLRRLSSLIRWLEKEDVQDLVRTAGFALPPHSGTQLAKTNPREQPESPTGVKITKLDTDDGGEISSAPKRQQFQLSGRPDLENFLNDHVIDIIENIENYKKLGINFPSAIILHGPPGCGKTFAVERLVEYLDWPNFNIDSNSVGSPYIHETSRKVSQIFEKAIDAAPSVIVIDEMESYLSDRQIEGSTGLHHVEEVAEFLRRIPEANNNNVLVIGMTNRIEMIDSAISRRGRFDHIIEVGMPSEAEVTELLDSLLEKRSVNKEIDRQPLIQALTGRPLSDTDFIVREAARLAGKNRKNALDQESLHLALKMLPAQEAKRRPIGFIQD